MPENVIVANCKTILDSCRFVGDKILQDSCWFLWVVVLDNPLDVKIRCLCGGRRRKLGLECDFFPYHFVNNACI